MGKNTDRNKLKRWEKRYIKITRIKVKRRRAYTLVRDRRKLFVEVMDMLIDETDVQTAEEFPDKVLKMFQMRDEVDRALRKSTIKFQELNLQDKLRIEELYTRMDKLMRKDEPFFVLVKKEKIKKKKKKNKKGDKGLEKKGRHRRLREYYIEKGVIEPK